MTTQKNVGIRLKNGIIFRIPTDSIEKIVMPSVVIRGGYRRLVVKEDDINSDMDFIIRKALHR